MDFKPLGPCPCDFCEAERWAVRVLADPATPALIRITLNELLEELMERRVSRLVAQAAPLTRWGRLRRAAAAWWERQADGARRGLGWLADEPAVVVASALWSSLWAWATIAWALAVGGGALRVLAVLAGVAFVVVNVASLRRMEGDR